MSPRRRGRPSADDTTTLSTEEVLDAALEAFGEKGYDGTSVRELSRALGVSHNLIPQRIGSKEQLWFAAVDQGFASLAATLVQALSYDDFPDDLARLRALVLRFIEANAARPALLRIISQEASAPGPRLDHLFTSFIAPVRDLGGDVLARLEQSGQVRTSSVTLLYFMMTHGAGGPLAMPALAEHFGMSVDRTDPDAIHRHAVEATAFIFDGLLLPEGSHPASY